jgi:ELWxxDGT repeat protein
LVREAIAVNPFRVFRIVAALVLVSALSFVAGSAVPGAGAAAVTTTELVRDINPGGDTSNSQNFAAFDGDFYFAADDGTHDAELWKSDGTEAGTTMVKDIDTSGASDPHDLVVLGDSLYFGAYSGGSDNLWKTDGTESGTVMVDSNSHEGVDPEEITVFDGKLYFEATDDTHGYELWTSDGTEAGTTMVKDINTSGPSDPRYLTVFDGKLYFQATDGTDDGGDHHGNELWKSNGTSSGTTMVKDINSGGDSSPQYLTAFGDSLYFSAIDANGRELWKSNGTSSGTTMVADINPGSGDGSPEGFTVGGHTLFFSADDGAHGAEPWKFGDFSPPETSIDSGPSGTTGDSTPTFAFSSDEPGTFECSLDSGAYASCTSPDTVGPLTAGSHTFRVRATDASGNTDATPASRSFTVTGPPNTTITSHPRKKTFSNKATFRFSSDKSGATFQCKLDSRSWAACTSPKSYKKLSRKKHTFRVGATAFGLTDSTPASYSWKIKHNGKIKRAKLTKRKFHVYQAKKVKLTVKFAPKSKKLAWKITLKHGKKWKAVKSKTKHGSFSKKKMSVKALFAGKKMRKGRYKLKLSADRNSKTLKFRIV